MTPNQKNSLRFASVALGTTAAASGALVQITLFGNQIIASGDSLNADLTGDGTDDIAFGLRTYTNGSISQRGSVFLTAPGGSGRAANASSFITASGGLEGFALVPGTSIGNSASSFAPGGELTGGILLTLTDSNFGLTDREAFLEVIAGGTDSDRGVTLTRVVFNDDPDADGPLFADVVGQGAFPEAVPEVSSLALLALGAGGILLRRKRQNAA